MGVMALRVPCGWNLDSRGTTQADPMTNITTAPQRFTFAPGIELRVSVKNGQPWFVASDVARALGYRDASNMARILDSDEKGTHLVSTPHGQQSMLVIDQSGLFNAVLKSTKQEAKTYRKWVTGTVLPHIHRQGAYSVGAEHLPHAQQVALYEAFRAQTLEALKRHDRLTQHDHWVSASKRQERSLTGC